MAGESFDPYDLATQGQNSFSPFTLSIQGQITDIIIEDIIVPETAVPIIIGGGGWIPSEYPADAPVRKIKKITVRCMLNDKEYTDTAYSTDLTITASNIKVSIDESKVTPRIIIEIVGK